MMKKLECYDVIAGRLVEEAGMIMQPKKIWNYRGDINHQDMAIKYNDEHYEFFIYLGNNLYQVIEFQNKKDIEENQDEFNGLLEKFKSCD